MSLLNPLGLLGLISLPVIVGLHLHMSRSRQVTVSSMHLWSFLDEKFQGSTPRLLQISWLLVLDLLIAAVLSLALAKPQIKLDLAPGADTQVVMLLDTSSSMLATDVSPSRFAAAKSDLLNLLDSLESRQTAEVYAVGSRAALLGSTVVVDVEELAAGVEGVAAGGSSADFRQVFSRVALAADPERPVVVHIFTDGAFPDDSFADFPFPMVWHFYGEGGNNQAITKLEVKRVESSDYQVLVEISNLSLQARSREIRILADGEEVNRGELVIPSGESATYIVSQMGSFGYVQAELLGSDYLAEDDLAGAGLVEREVIRAALVTYQPDPLQRAIQAAPEVDLEVIPPEEYSYTAGYDVTIFRGYLPEAWPSGVAVVFDPPLDANILRIGGLQTIRAPLEASANPVTDGIDFSGVRWDRAWTIGGTGLEFSPLLQADGMPLLVQADTPQGSLFVFLPALDLGSLTIHPAFPLLVANLLEAGRGFTPAQNYRVGEAVDFHLADYFGEASLISPAGMTVSIPDSGSVELDQPGKYTFSHLDEQGEEITVTFGVNAGDLQEAEIKMQDWSEDFFDLEPEMGRPKKLVIGLAPWLLVLAVGLLLMEAWRGWR